MKVAIILSALAVVTLGYFNGAGREQCNNLSAACQDQTHGPPNTYQPDHRYVIRERQIGAYDVTFQMRQGDGNLIGYAFQIRDFGELGQGRFPRGYMTLANLTYDRLFPCPGVDGSPHSNGITQANATKGKADIDAGQIRNEIYFLWDNQLPGSIDDTPECGKVIGTVMGYEGLWWPNVVSDCFINCMVEGCTNNTVSNTEFIPME